MHAWSVFLRFNAVKDLLIELSSKVTCKPMQFSLILLNCKNLAIVAPKVLIIALGQFLKFWLIRIGQVSKSKDIL